MNATRRRIVAAAVALSLLAAAGAFLAYRHRAGSGPDIVLPKGHALQVAQLETLQRVPAFSLERAGPPLTPDDLHGRWSFVFFGYTNCPNACPETLGILSHVQEVLRARGMAPPRIVFLSLDPERDRPQVLHDYMAAFDPDAIGATGSQAALRGLLGFFGIVYERRDRPDGKSYTLDHTSSFFLLTPENRWLATFAPAQDPEAILQDTQTLLEARYKP